MPNGAAESSQHACPKWVRNTLELNPNADLTGNAAVSGSSLSR